MAGPWEKYQTGPWAKYQRGDMQSRVAAAKAGTLEASPESLDAAARADQRAMDQMVLSETGRTGALATKVTQGLPIVGEWVDEGIGLVSPERRDNLRNIQGAMEREHPVQSTVAQIGGGIVGALATGSAGAGAVKWTQGGKSPASRALRGGSLGLMSGAVEGAIQGAGAANDGDRVRGALRGALVGAGFGAVLGGAAPFIADGASNLIARAKRLDTATISDEFGLSMPAARSVKRALMNDDLDEATRLLARGGDDAMLADAGNATGALLDASSQTGGAALDQTRRAVNARANAAGERLRTYLDDTLGTADGVRAGNRQIAQRTAAVRDRLYTNAYSQPINYADDSGRAIEAVLDRIPPKTLRSAIEEANDAMREAGAKNLQIMAEIGDDGSVAFREMPNVQQLDYIKRALGDIASRETDDITGKITAAGTRANRLAGDLRDAITEAVPTYGRAVKVGGDKIAEGRAFEIGTKLLSRSTSLEDVRDVMRGASIEARTAAQRGMRQNIENSMSTVKRAMSDPNVDAREAWALIRDMSSRDNIAKVRLVLGNKADDFLKELDRASVALELRARTAQNSATAVRGAIQDQVKAEAQPGLLRRVLGKGGNPLDAAQEVTASVMGIDPQSISESEKAIFDEIAGVLTGMRGAEAQRALSVVKGAIEGQRIKQADAELIGRLTAAHLANATYQTGTQLLSQ